MKIIFLDIDGVISTEKSHYVLDKDTHRRVQRKSQCHHSQYPAQLP